MFSTNTVESYRELSIFSLRREGVLREGFSTSWVWSDAETGVETSRIGLSMRNSALHLNYRVRWHGGDWQEVSDTIPLSNTRPAMGGVRWWFVCPSCYLRRAKLYSNTYFRCRGCLGLCYSSQLEHPRDRTLRRLYKRRHALGGYGGACAPFPNKPKWMRWATYAKLRENDCRDMVEIDRHSLQLLSKLRASTR